MEEHKKFTTQAEIDSWYEQTIDGLRKAIATEYDFSTEGNLYLQEYHVVLTGLNRTMLKLYSANRINMAPPVKSLGAIIESIPEIHERFFGSEEVRS